MKFQPLFLALSVALLAPTGCDEEMSEKLETLDSAQDPADDLAAEDEESEPESAVEISEIDEFTDENDPSMGGATCVAYLCGGEGSGQRTKSFALASNGASWCLTQVLLGCVFCDCLTSPET